MWAEDRRLASTLIVACLLLLTNRVASGAAAELQQAFNEAEDNQNEDNFGQLAESLAIASSAGAGANLNTNLQCEKISFAFCASMPYNFTRMPNFMRDSNQIEAAERAKHYELLAKTHCSRHLLSYLCELLAPMCLDGESMKRFGEIYPCRSFCRQVRHDCLAQLQAIYGLFGPQQQHQQQQQQQHQQVLALFACDQLPYEENGGDGANGKGPCHEIPDLGPAPRPAHNNQFDSGLASVGSEGGQSYRPYERDPDLYNPEDTRIDPNILRPLQPASKHRSSADPNRSASSNSSLAPLYSNPVWLARIDATALKLAWTLLGILVMGCLFLLLKVRLAAASSASSRKSSASDSSSGSQRRLASSSAAGGHKQCVSPSASSRSLMLLAGRAHDELLAEAPSQKLLHQAGLAQRTTLINLNGTLERGQSKQQQQQQEVIRYHLMQSLGGQSQLLAQHQYDYIQVGSVDAAGQQNKPQMQAKIADLDGFKARRELHEAALRSAARHQHATSTSSSSGATKITAAGQRGQAEASKLYSNILLSSPSHQVLLLEPTEQRGARLAGPPALQFGPGAQQRPAEGGAYDTPLVAYERHQRSFQRRPSFGAGQAGSLSSSGRHLVRARHHAHLLAHELAGEPAPAPARPFANSFASSASTSEASASGAESAGSSSSFSPPATIGKLQQRGAPV